MNSLVIYPTTTHQFSLLKELLKEMKIRFAITKAEETDDTLMSKTEYFAMLDERIKSAERGNVHRLTPEVEMELFGINNFS